jgi:excisionase family DNA binding protein
MSTNIQVQRICQQCGKEFTAKTTTTRYCSHICNSRAYKANVRGLKIELSNTQVLNIKTKPVEELKVKPYLSIMEACTLLGISRRTLYRMLQRREINAGKAGKRTIIRSSDLDRLFEHPQPEYEPEPRHYEINECYNLTEIQEKYGISERAMQNLIKRCDIPKIKNGRYAYVPKVEIEKYFELR